MAFDNKFRMDMKGEKGKSLFYKFEGNIFSKENIDALSGIMKKYIETLKLPDDDRAFVIVCALCIENSLDDLLDSWIKNYKEIRDRHDLTFSFKIELAKSMKLIPAKILNAIEPIRKIRNIFAHQLDLHTLSEVQKSIVLKSSKNVFDMLFDKIKTFAEWHNKDVKETFKQLTFFILVGLNGYGKHLKMVMDYIWHDENIEKIIKEL